MLIRDQLLFCEKLSLTATATDVFRVLNDFFKTHEISRNEIASICIDICSISVGTQVRFCELSQRD